MEEAAKWTYIRELVLMALSDKPTALDDLIYAVQAKDDHVRAVDIKTQYLNLACEGRIRLDNDWRASKLPG